MKLSEYNQVMPHHNTPIMFVRDTENKIISACFLGQIALSENLVPEDNYHAQDDDENVYQALYAKFPELITERLSTTIWMWNDYHTFDEVSKKLAELGF